MNLPQEHKMKIEKIIVENLNRPNSNHYFSEKHREVFLNIIAKLNSDDFKLTKVEAGYMTLLTSLVIEDFGKKYPSDSNLFWVNVSSEMKEKMEEKDILLDILGQTNKSFIKSNFHYNLNFRSRNVLALVEKMQNSQTILLSTKSDPYKIGFVYNLNEIIVFEMKSGISIDGMTFHKIDNYKELKDSFASELTRKEVFEIISKIENRENYSRDNVEFFLELLK